jgi:hypothetical protein
MLLKLYRMSANTNGVVRRQNAWLERVEIKGGGRGVAPDREGEDQGLDG